MKVGDEIMVKARVIELMTNPAPKTCDVGVWARIEIRDLFSAELVDYKSVVRFLIDPAKLVLIPEKK